MKSQGKAKVQFDDYWRQTIEAGRRQAASAEQAQRASQRSGYKPGADDGEAKRKTARRGL